MHRYPPSPVSMQVALPAQGLDEHRRVSVVQKKKMLFLDLVCSPSSSPVSLPVFSPHAFVSTLSLTFTPQHLVTTNKTANAINHAAQASSSYAAPEQEMYCVRSQGGQTEPEARKTLLLFFSLCSLFCLRGSEWFFLCHNDHCRHYYLSANSKWGCWKHHGKWKRL